MIDSHDYDPELQPVLAQLPTLTLDATSLPIIRTMIDAAPAQPFTESFPGIAERSAYIPGPSDAPEVRVLLFYPRSAAAPRPAILHVHGGGYVLGKPEISREVLRHYAAAMDCVIASVDYRLAPETPFPGPLEDCYAALTWLHDQADELGVDRRRLAVAGESAGGGLAAALALLARDRGRIPLCYQHLIYPMIDDRTCTKTDVSPCVGQHVWSLDTSRFGWSSLLGQPPGGPDVSAYAAAARCESLEGLPPTYIAVGALDLFLEEDLDYARRLMRAGVPVELHVYPRAFHGFNAPGTTARVSLQAQRDALASFKRAFEVA